MAKLDGTISLKRLKELLHYDPDTGVFVWKIRHGFPKKGSIAGSLNEKGYRRITINDVRYLAHRLAWLYMYGEWPKGQIDHINGARDDNAISNLRDVSSGENMQNRKGAHSNSKTGVLGASLASHGRFAAQIQVKGKHVHIGYYDTAMEAHRAYLKAKRKLHPACTI